MTLPCLNLIQSAFIFVRISPSDSQLEMTPRRPKRREKLHGQLGARRHVTSIPYLSVTSCSESRSDFWVGFFTMQFSRKAEAMRRAFDAEDEICKGQVQLSLGNTSVRGGDNDRQQNATPISESCRESFAARGPALHFGCPDVNF